MQRAGYVRRRNYYREDRPRAAGIGGKVAAFNPELKPIFLRGLGIECFAELQGLPAILIFRASRAEYARYVDFNEPE
jgi:hypothetical protein